METKVRRQILHNKLCDILGSTNVYYQSPSSAKMHYPCIRYKRVTNRSMRADNKRYLSHDAYEILYISEYPDDDIPDKLEDAFPYIRRESRYIGDGLYHDPFYLYFKGGN